MVQALRTRDTVGSGQGTPHCPVTGYGLRGSKGGLHRRPQPLLEPAVGGAGQMARASPVGSLDTRPGIPCAQRVEGTFPEGAVETPGMFLSED